MGKGSLPLFLAASLLGCGEWSEQADGPGGRVPTVSLDIDPYVVDLGTDHAKLAFRTRGVSAPLVRFGLTLDYEIHTTRLAEGLQHAVVLDGLEPDTTYHYEVGRIARGSFRTDPIDGGFSFVAIGHTHGAEGYGHYPDSQLISMVDGLDPSFVIHSGDATFHAVVADYKEYYFRLFRRLQSRVPVYISPANHDAGWPFTQGRDLRTFKELFPYPFPDGIRNDKENAHYRIEKAGVLLLFLSYTSPLEPGSPQYEWLSEQLTTSEHPFKFLVLGGSNEQYFDEQRLLDLAVDRGVDAVFMGDGSSSEARREHQGMPVYFTGTLEGLPHPLLYCEVFEDRVLVRLYFANGTPGPMLDWIYADHEIVAKRELSTDFLPRVAGSAGHRLRYEFSPALSVPEFLGIQLTFESALDEGYTVWASFRPKDATDPGEAAIRTQHRRYRGERGERVRLAFPETNPFTGKGMEITHIVVEVLGVGDAPAIESVILY